MRTSVYRMMPYGGSQGRLQPIPGDSGHKAGDTLDGEEKGRGVASPPNDGRLELSERTGRAQEQPYSRCSYLKTV
ncbi:hypothetical protein AMELA_G00027000 [Ameiurus melas]|uniref:Uncharacterized protein n=1 Tax=Ameiurus melas TaxID=219545 RepID=A0A7J6BDP5_AMEME|nr:hypothetical protein AMELA_G00027000 [Ameiurus melas]